MRAYRAYVASSDDLSPAVAPHFTKGATPNARGIARRLDDLGRLVIPKEYRTVFGIREGDLVDITIEGDAIAVRRLEVRCCFCDSTEDLGMFRTQFVCGRCVSELRTGAGAPDV